MKLFLFWGGGGGGGGVLPTYEACLDGVAGVMVATYW